MAKTANKVRDMEVREAHRIIMMMEELRPTEKMKLLSDNADNMVLRELLCKALSPYATFGITGMKIPAATPVKALSDVVFNYVNFLGITSAMEERSLTGNSAKAALVEFLSNCTSVEQTVYRRVLQKDLRAGLQAKTVNKAIPGLVPTFDIMLAEPYDPSRLEYPVYAESKIDGFRNLVDTDIHVSFSRGGHALENFPHIVNEVADLFPEAMMIDGEIVHPEGFNQTMTQLFRKSAVDTEDFLYIIFETMTKDEFNGVVETPYLERRKRRRSYAKFAEGKKQFGHLRFVRSRLIYGEDEMFAYYTKMRKLGFEGLVLKDPYGLYVQRRSHSWMKVKPDTYSDCVDVDLPVIGYREGKGKYTGTLGAFVVAYRGTKVRVGSGLPDHLRDEYYERLKAGERFVIRVIAQGETPDGSLRHPRFIDERVDLCE